jgi:acetoin utilization deacetylase AcuC-like enzyme
VLATSEPHLDSQIEFKTERLAYPVIAKVTTVCSGFNGPVKQSKVFSTALSSESKKKEKVGKTSAQILESSMASPIPLWNSRRKSCLSGRNAPIRSLLVKFLATRPEYEIYTGQDLHDNDDDELTRILALSIAGDDAPQLSYASERICMWDNVRLVKVEGEEAPMRCDLTAFIATNPERDVYINQEEMLQAERDRATNSDSDSDESSVKRISKGSKAKSKVAQLLASIKHKEEVIPVDSAVISGDNPVSEGVDDSQTEDDNASSSSSQFAAFSSSSGSGLSHYGDDEDHDDSIVRQSDSVPLKRGRKARAFKKGDLSLSSKSVKPLKKGHVSVWNKLRQCRVSGGNAPLRSQLTKFLATRPEYEVWVGQERNRKKKTSSEPNGADGEECEGEEGEGEGEGDGGERGGEREGEDEKEMEGDGDGEGDDAHIGNVDTEDHEDEGDEDHELEEYEDVAAASSMMVVEEDRSSPPTFSAVSPTSAALPHPDEANSHIDVAMVCAEQQADEQPTASPPVAEQPAPSIPSAGAEEQDSSPFTRRISRKRAMSADLTVSPIPSPVRPSTPTLPVTNTGVLGNDSVTAAVAKSTGNSSQTLAAPSQCVAVVLEGTAASNIKIEADTALMSTVEVDTSSSLLALPAEPPKSSYPPAIKALLLPDQLSFPVDTVIPTASCLAVSEEGGVMVAPDRLATAITNENKGDNDTASMDIVRPAIPDKGFVILPSRAKRRRELANLDDPTPSASSGIFGMEAEESPSPSGDAHLINGRAVVGDRFIVHCGEGNVVSGPGWWEDLDAGASDTYISPCSFDAAVAAAAVVCAGVDAVTLGCVLGCDLLATAKANENSESSAFHTEEPAPSSLNSPIRQHHDTDILKDKTQDLTSSEDRRQVLGAVTIKGPESVEANSPLPNEGMGVEEISELMIGFLEECNSTIDNPLKQAAGAVCSETSGAMEIESLELQPTPAAQDAENKNIVVIDKEQNVPADSEVQSSACDEDFKDLSSTAGTGAGTGTGGEVRDRVEDSATVPAAASISTHTRSKAGLVAAAGVVTAEMLSSVAADTPVTLTEVQGVKNVFCCIRPPGHHAGRFGSTRGCSNNGFCLLNNVAIGAYYARIKYGLRRFAVVDIDAHFGNGTAEIFEGDPHAFYSSVHLQYDGPKDYFFPSSNCCILGAEERHPNRVLVNVYPPVRAGNPLSKSGKRRSRGGFRSSFEDVIIPALRIFNPDIIFISAGFDGASTDPIGGQVGLKPIDFHWMAEKIQIVADEVCGGRVVSVLEGGYDVSKAADGLATCAEAHVLALAGRDYR